MTNEFENLMNKRKDLKPLATTKTLSSINDEEVQELNPNKQDFIQMLGIKKQEPKDERCRISLYIYKSTETKLKNLAKEYGYKNPSAFLNDLVKKL